METDVVIKCTIVVKAYEAWKLETGHKLPEALKLLVCISGLRVMTPFSKGGYIIEEIPICDF